MTIELQKIKKNHLVNVLINIANKKTLKNKQPSFYFKTATEVATWSL